MTIYRLTKAIYAETAFRGSRGRGRWHKQGVPMVYAADLAINGPFPFPADTRLV